LSAPLFTKDSKTYYSKGKMPDGLYTVDFHAHIQTTGEIEQLLNVERERGFIWHLAPAIELVANLSEPVHDGILRQLALNFRDGLSRSIYSRLGALGLIETLRLFKANDFKRLIDSMNANGINHVVIHSLEPLTMTAEILELTAGYRDRVSVFVSVARTQPDPVGYVTPFIESGSVAGIKLHPVVGGYACGELYHATKDVVRLAESYQLPVMIHTGHIPVEGLSSISGCNEVKAIEPMIADFPRVRFILAHIGWESWREVLKISLRYPNVYVETSWQPARIIRRAVDLLGPERVIFGSDFPLFRQSLALAQVRAALSPMELAAVLSTNALRLLSLAPPQDAGRRQLAS